MNWRKWLGLDGYRAIGSGNQVACQVSSAPNGHVDGHNGHNGYHAPAAYLPVDDAIDEPTTERTALSETPVRRWAHGNRRVYARTQAEAEARLGGPAVQLELADEPVTVSGRDVAGGR